MPTCFIQFLLGDVPTRRDVPQDLRNFCFIAAVKHSRQRHSCRQVAALQHYAVIHAPGRT